MPAIDTNVLLRYLVADDRPQRAAVLELIQRHAAAGDLMFIPVTVLLETEWVLRTSFKLDKAQVLDLLVRLVGAEPMSFDSPFAVAVALDLYRDSGADFADCLHLALCRHAGEVPMYTFDRKAARMEDAERVVGATSLDQHASRLAQTTPRPVPPGRSASC